MKGKPITTTTTSGTLCLQFWEIEYHIPDHWTTSHAVEQTTSFVKVLLDGYEAKLLKRLVHAARVDALQEFLRGIATYLPTTIAYHKTTTSQTKP